MGRTWLRLLRVTRSWLMSWPGTSQRRLSRLIEPLAPQVFFSEAQTETHFCAVVALMPRCVAERLQPLVTPLYRSTDRRCRVGATM